MRNEQVRDGFTAIAGGASHDLVPCPLLHILSLALSKQHPCAVIACGALAV